MGTSDKIKSSISNALKAAAYDKFVDFRVFFDDVGHSVEFWFSKENLDEEIENQITAVLVDTSN